MTRLVAYAVVTWLLGAAGAVACSREPELASGHIVVRNAAGAVTEELRATPYGYLDKNSGVRFRVADKTVDTGEVRMEAGVLRAGGTVRATLERQDGRIKLYDPVRVPLGQLVERDGKTWAYDPGGTPLGAARADGDRVVLTDRDGGAKGFVTAASQPAAAAMLLPSKLSDLEKTVVAIYLTRF